jgi:hypothetical protein
VRSPHESRHFGRGGEKRDRLRENLCEIQCEKRHKYKHSSPHVRCKQLLACKVKRCARIVAKVFAKDIASVMAGDIREPSGPSDTAVCLVALSRRENSCESFCDEVVGGTAQGPKLLRL